MQHVASLHHQCLRLDSAVCSAHVGSGSRSRSRCLEVGCHVLAPPTCSESFGPCQRNCGMLLRARGRWRTLGSTPSYFLSRRMSWRLQVQGVTAAHAWGCRVGQEEERHGTRGASNADLEIYRCRIGSLVFVTLDPGRGWTYQLP